MGDYNSYKVPELKKILSERSLSANGVKAELIARLLDDDKKKSTASQATASAPPPGDDEIDWDEDDAKATTAPAAAAVAAGGQGPVKTPAAVPNQNPAKDPSKTSDLDATDLPHAEAEPPKETAAEEAKPAEPKQDFSAHLEQTDAEKEAHKRAERAKRFGLPVDTESEETKKLAARAEKFGTDNEMADVKGLDSALPDRRERKRGRDDREGQGGRNDGSKRRNDGGRGRDGGGRNGRNGVAGGNGVRKTGGGAGRNDRGGGGGGGRGGRRVLDDPVEKAKAEARALKFKTN